MRRSKQNCTTIKSYIYLRGQNHAAAHDTADPALAHGVCKQKPELAVSKYTHKQARKQRYWEKVETWFWRSNPAKNTHARTKGPPGKKCQSHTLHSPLLHDSQHTHIDEGFPRDRSETKLTTPPPDQGDFDTDHVPGRLISRLVFSSHQRKPHSVPRFHHATNTRFEHGMVYTIIPQYLPRIHSCLLPVLFLIKTVATLRVVDAIIMYENPAQR